MQRILRWLGRDRGPELWPEPVGHFFRCEPEEEYWRVWEPVGAGFGADDHEVVDGGHFEDISPWPRSHWPGDLTC